MKLIKLFTIPTFLFSINSAMAATQSTIAFSGEIVESSCVIDTGSENLAVALPKVSVASFGSSGALAGDTQFKIGLNSCNSETVKIGFTPIENGDLTDASGHILNTGTAKNIALALYQEDGSTLIDLSDSSAASNSASVENEAATLGFVVKYISTGTVEAGTVIGSIKYEVQYD